MQPAISPDGDWIAYTSDRTGTFEAYVARVPALGDRLLLSTDGGQARVWSDDGSELFYRRLSDGAMMMVPIAGSPVLTPGPAELLPKAAGYSTGAAI